MVQAVFTLLLDLHPSGQRLPGGGRKDHWADILGDYRRIRRLVLDNQQLSANANIQLSDVNRRTLTQWYNKILRTRDLASLTMGTDLPRPPMTATDLPPPEEKSIFQVPSEEVLQQPPPLEDKSGTAVQRSQTRAVPDDEATSADPPLYAAHSGEGICVFTSPEQVLGWL
ncbi:hypothetical protein EGW08_001295, partial [Elysia chlorotica]